MTYSKEYLYVVDPEGDFIVDIIQTDDEEEDIEEDSSDGYGSDGFDDYDPYGEYFEQTGQDFHMDPEDPERKDPIQEYDRRDEERYRERQSREKPGEEEAQGGNAGEEEGDDNSSSTEPQPKKLRRTSFQVASKCLTLGSEYFRGLFQRNTWIESQTGRVQIHALWKGFKAFKILMQIAHLQFFKIPDKLSTDNMVNLIKAADYLKMEPLFNPWLFRWAMNTPELEETEENYMKRLYINMHLCFSKDFRQSYNRLVEGFGPEYSTYGLLIPENLLDSLKHSRNQKLRKLMSTVNEIINVCVTEDELDNIMDWCVLCRKELFGHLMLRLHADCLYPPDTPEYAINKNSYEFIYNLIKSALEGVEATRCGSARDGGDTCSFDWALHMLLEMKDETPLPDSDMLGVFTPGWEKLQLKTWVLYRKGRSLDSVDFPRHDYVVEEKSRRGGSQNSFVPAHRSFSSPSSSSAAACLLLLPSFSTPPSPSPNPLILILTSHQRSAPIRGPVAKMFGKAENRTFFIEANLMRVNSIFDMTHYIIEELQSLPGKRIVIRRFAISPIDIRKWIEENGSHKGLEYDVADNSISIKPEENAIRKAIREAFQEEFFQFVIDRLYRHLPDETFSTSYNDPHDLYGEFSGDLVCSDGQIDQKGSPSPRIVVLIGPKKEIVHGANKWIRGGNNKTEFVIGVQVSERPPMGWCPWDLERRNIAEMDLEDLTDYIVDYHEDHHLPIVGLVRLKVFVFTKDNIGIPYSELVPSWSCMFGPEPPYEDTHGRVVPDGITTSQITGMSSITLPEDMGEVELPFDEIKDKVEEGIEEEKRDRALVMATEAKNWASMNLRGAPLLPPFPG